MGFEVVATLPRDTKVNDRYFDGVMMRKEFAFRVE